jgi:hypothetical protein
MVTQMPGHVRQLVSSWRARGGVRGEGGGAILLPILAARVQLTVADGNSHIISRPTCLGLCQ